MTRSEVIRELINNSGLTLKAFSEKAGVPYTTLRSILERGIGNSAVDNVIKICKALNITIDELEELSEGTVKSENTRQRSVKDDDIITLAAHRSGHEGALSEEDMERVKLAIQIALAKNKK